jgi:hypothetical protein
VVWFGLVDPFFGYESENPQPLFSGRTHISAFHCPSTSTTSTTTILLIPTGVTVVGMDMDVPAFPTVTLTKENTNLINDMEEVFTSGMMEESTMACLVKTRDTEGYVRAFCYSFFGPSRKDDDAQHKFFFLGSAVGACWIFMCFLTCHWLFSFFLFLLDRVSSSGLMVPCTMENLSMDNVRVMANIPLVMAVNTMEPGGMVDTTGSGT